MTPSSIIPLENLARLSLQKGRLLGIDLGTKTIGVAVSDDFRLIASPLKVIQRTKFRDDSNLLIDLLQQFAIQALIVGFPANMDGSEGPRAQSTQSFTRNFKEICDIPIAYWDERLSTKAVTRTLLDAGSSRARRKELVDKMAAAYILQGALDRLSYLNSFEKLEPHL